MKSTLYDFFVWSAGSDREILNRCGRSEHIKHAGYGGLVLVPAVLGLFTMMYAVSTLTDKPFVFIGAGLIWACIVFTFDRFIVATFRKSGSPRKDLFSFLFLSRLLFAIGIGILVSHPMVLLVFNDSLEQELGIMREEGEKALYDQYERDIDVVRSRDSTLKGEVAVKIAERQCKEKLLLFEMSGKDTTMTCGTTSGIKQYGPRANEIKEEIRYLNTEITALQGKNDQTIGVNSQEIAKLQAERDKKLAAFRESFSYNYLAREIALERLKAKPIGGEAVTWTMWFLMLFFILVDVLPVAFKAATRPGEYDRLLEKEDLHTAESYPAYERTQEDRVRKAYTEALTDKRMGDLQETFAAPPADFPALLKESGQYLNVPTAYTYGQAADGEGDTFAKLWQQNGLNWLRYGFFALAQALVLVLLTREWAFLFGGIWVLFALNALIGNIVNKTLRTV
jgi:hypothetical protein